MSSLSQWNLRDTYSLQTRNHLFRFGVDEQHISSSLTPPGLSILADFFTLDSLLNNAASDLVITRSTPANPVLNDFALFVDDAWKLSSRLNLSAGLRWDVSPAPKGSAWPGCLYGPGRRECARHLATGAQRHRYMAYKLV